MTSNQITETTVTQSDLRYTRRRYGRKTFTWVEAFVSGEWHSLGDPWECLMPARREIQEAIRFLRLRLDAEKPQVAINSP